MRRVWLTAPQVGAGKKKLILTGDKMIKKTKIKELKKDLVQLKAELELIKGEEFFEPYEGVLASLRSTIKQKDEAIKELKNNRDLYRGRLRKQTEGDLLAISIEILVRIFQQDHSDETLQSLRDRQCSLYEEYK